VPILIVRDEGGNLNAFVNICRHRATEVAEGRGKRMSLQCPYHAWSYELDGSLRLNSTLQGYVGYTFVHATVLQYPGDPGGIDLVGLDVPQVPRHVFTWGLYYKGLPRWSVSVSGRFVGQQFDDDQNQFVLHRFYTTDFQVVRTIRQGFEVFFAAENFFDQRYETARTPTLNLGPPALFRLGMRVNLPSKAAAARAVP
jgi:outer membrane receptor for Fe3+-dicitrate